MRDNNQHKVDLQKLAETGWKQMHETLREQGLSNDEAVLPSDKNRKKMFLLMAACLFLILLISSTIILNNHSYFSHDQKNKIAHSVPGKTENANASTKNIVVSENHDASNDPSSEVMTPQQKLVLHQKLNEQLSSIEREIFINQFQSRKASLIKKLSFEKDYNISIPACDNIIDGEIKIQPNEFSTKNIESKNLKRIKVFAGAGFNVSTAKNSFSLNNINVHPGITLVIPVSPKLNIHTGLWALSTIHVNVSAKDKELQNSFSPNIYYNINTTSIIKASYFDVPLTLHYCINKKWSVGSGLQLSKLYKVNIEEQKQSFDYNNTLYSATVQQINATPTRAAAAFQQKLDIKKFETRFVAATNYETGKFLLSAGYYYGLGKTIFLKDGVNSNRQYRNVYFKLGIQYRIY